MSSFDFTESLKEVMEMIPTAGYNICSFDDFARPGEKLTLEDHVETEEQAKKIKKDLEKNGLKVMIYAAEGLEEGIENLFESENAIDFKQNKNDAVELWEFWQVDMKTHEKIDDTTMIVKAEHYGQAIDDYIANWNTTHQDMTVGYPNVQGRLHKESAKEGIENLFGPPASQAFADTGNNPHIDQTKLGKPFDEKSDTGDDKTRTGPGGNLSRENYDSIHYQSTNPKGPKIHLATPYYDGKEPHDVSGTIPELREDIKITIEDPKQDENIPKIELEIAGDEVLEPELEIKKPEQELELETVDDSPGVFTQKGDELAQSIEISDIWKGDNVVLAEGSLIAKKYLKFKYNSGKTECPICKPLAEMEFADDDPKRPILPSEKMGEGVYNTHPNCLCTYEAITKYEDVSLEPKSDAAQSRAAASSLTERHDITNEYLRPLQESLNIYKDRQPGEFDWINDEAIENMKNFTREHPDGRFILAVVSGESYTDHRIEGENLRRHWTNEELIQNIRTAKHKLTDINHMWQKKDPMSGLIFDANWNFTTNRGEMAIWESDPEILDAIRKDIITAVSINTGKPRGIDENCDSGECLSEPKGTVLGEDNNVALAFIVTGPEGWNYNGQHIPAMPPGMKFTKIFIIE